MKKSFISFAVIIGILISLMIIGICRDTEDKTCINNDLLIQEPINNKDTYNNVNVNEHSLETVEDINAFLEEIRSKRSVLNPPRPILRGNPFLDRLVEDEYNRVHGKEQFRVAQPTYEELQGQLSSANNEIEELQSRVRELEDQINN